MTLDEYKAEVKKIRSECEVNIVSLSRKFLESNRTIKAGDIIKDHIGLVKVEQFGMYFRDGIPYGIYTGPCYTKQGKPFKSGETRSVYQINLVE